MLLEALAVLFIYLIFKLSITRLQSWPRQVRSLIYGIGNPSLFAKYQRHNVGKLLVNLLREEGWKKEGALLFESGVCVNRSGMELKQLTERYEIKPWNVIVVSDDLQSRCGSMKVSNVSSHRGHKGLKSIIEQFGQFSKEIRNIKIGIGRPQSRQKAEVRSWVLGNLQEQEQGKLDLHLFRLMLQKELA